MTSNPASVGPAPDGLLPCPFCGGSPELNDYTDKPACAWVLVHRNKACPVAPQILSFGTEAQAIAAWNTRAPHPDREAEPTGGVSDLEQRAFHAANQPQSVECYQQLVRDLWRAVCEAEALSVSPPVVEGSLRASPFVPTEGHDAAVVGAISDLFVTGPVWKEPDLTDEDDNPIWTSEVQVIGGWSVVATVHGADEAEASQRAEVLCRALNAHQAAVSDDTQPGIFALRENEPKDRHQPTTPGEQEGAENV